MNQLPTILLLALSALFGGGVVWLLLRGSREAARTLARPEDTARIASLEADAKHREDRFGELQREHGELEETAKELQRQRLSLSQKEAELQAQVQAGLQATAVQTESQRVFVAELHTRMAALETARREAAEALEASRLEAKRLAAREAELRAQVEASAAALIQERESAAAMADELRLQIDSLKTTQANLERELKTARQATAELTAREAELQASLEAREAAFEEARQRLEERFKALAGQTLQANSEAFLQLARTTLEHSQAGAQSDLEARQTAISTLLEPLTQGLVAMDQQMRNLQEARSIGDAQLTSQLQTLTDNQQQLQGETGRLANALRKPQVRGRWGEMQLQNLVELAGMKEHVDFTTQSHVQVDDDRRRPDMLVRMPGGKCVAVDAKTPLGAYLDALEATSEQDKQAHLDKLPALIRSHVAQLADKRYYEGLPESPDFVVLFLHGEGPFALACEKDPELLQFAMSKNVLLATPVTLMALLKSTAFGWQQQRIQDNAEQIRATAADLIKRFAAMAGHIKGVGDGLGKAVGSYNAFAGSLERMVIPQAKRIQALGVQVYKKKGEVIELPVLDALHEAPRAIDLELLASFDEPETISPATELEA